MKRLIFMLFVLLPLLGVAQDAALWRQKADSLEAAGKEGDACFYRAKIVAAQGDAMHAMKYIKRGAKLGSADCTLLLGKIHEAKDELKEAADCYLTASTLGSADALVLYAKALLFGRGVGADPQAAYALFKSACKVLPDGEPERMLGSMHLVGQGCERNADSALHYFRLAVDHGNTQAMMLLGEV